MTRATNFSLGTFSKTDGLPYPGLLLGDSVIAVSNLEQVAAEHGHQIGHCETMLDILADWDRQFAAFKWVAESIRKGMLQGLYESAAVSVEALRTHAPVECPRQILMMRGNYRQHVIDMRMAQGSGEGATDGERRKSVEDMVDRLAREGEPMVFSKLPSAVAGPYDAIEIPLTTNQADWELELAVVIGRAARHVACDEAMKYVAGYCNVNDLSNRDLIVRRDLGVTHDWTAGKCSPGYLPMGPYLVPAEFVEDPHNLEMILMHNGVVRQQARTNDMIHDIPRAIEYVSRHIQLYPGDLICTGSPTGNGMHYGVFLKPGDVIEASISGLGTMRNSFIATASSRTASAAE